ncbi:DNA repair-scaffolding protein isoform X1 [Elephas maximus indicus]|uniref:DNA repair-scaffolding protein isoform X1 n=1 Tax=Elephas maximus indicus TaxID=99487 RepID=UPI002116FDA8|nr:DNA repair-scaffolding protein isoform X1 [Elephas maximus indicus]
MSGGGPSPGRKRKRNWDIEYPFFPRERPLQFRKASLRTVGAAASLSEAWLRCGEGFQDTSGTLVLTGEKKTITEKHLELSARPKEENFTSDSANGPAEITRCSSGSNLSDEEKTISKSANDHGHGSGINRFCSRKTVGQEDGASEDELQFIDWEADSDREDTNERSASDGGESAVEISDCASRAGSSSTSEGGLSELPKTNCMEILEYSSDSGKEDDSDNVLLIDSESPRKYPVDFGSDERQIMERLVEPWIKSTETVLYTPQKQTNKFPRTPEDSAKKKKPIRGGLAERLNELQNRERSAISFWRHQCVSYQKTLKGRKSGVLVVKILELHEECTMQVAICEQLEGLQADSTSLGIVPHPRNHLKVLFTKETASHLKGRPQDILHIYPPWQKLIIPDGSCPVILNTYFCQKITATEDSETTGLVHCQDPPLPRRSITLAQIFRLKGLTPEIQVTCGGVTAMETDLTQEQEEAKQHFPAHTSPSDSLLDVVGSQGAAAGSGARVRVVVQRVYLLPGKDDASCASCSDTGPSHARTMGLFSLIDTIWPPVMPLKTPGQSQPCEEVQADLPPPTFCYLLTAHPNLGQIDVIEEDPISKLYQPPVSHCLKEILQAGGLGTRCTFYARVIYQRLQVRSFLSVEQKEILLMVTDVTLQGNNESHSSLPKTVPVYVTSSCVLGPEVLEALTVAAPHSILFRDALRDQGRMVCVERSVLLLQKPLLCVASGACASDLTGPVRLDELGSRTQANSICSVRGTVAGVDESTAFSWPACDRCGNGRLEQSPEHREEAFYCGQCSHVVTSPALRRHLQVFLDCPSRSGCSVKVKLLQSSISSLLRLATCEDGSYEVKSVLAKEVGPLNCFVRSVASHPTSCIALEEIQLLSAGPAPVGHPLLPESL